MQQQITEICGIQGFQPFLIGLIQFRASVVIGARIRAWHAVRRQCAVLPAVDQAGKQPRRPALFINVGRRNQLFQQAQLIIRVQNGEIRLQPHQFGMPAQDFH